MLLVSVGHLKYDTQPALLYKQERQSPKAPRKKNAP